MKHLNLNDHKSSISTLLTFPRCPSQQGEEGVDEEGAATRWENSAEKKEKSGAAGEEEYSEWSKERKESVTASRGEAGGQR